MTQTNLVIPTVLTVFVILAIVAMATRAGRTHRPLLTPLTSEARHRYAARWDQIESRFVEAPEEAVAQADALALAILGECDHPLAEKKLPDRIRKARRDASRGGTEGMRVAMLDYRAVIEEMAREPEALGPLARDGGRRLRTGSRLVIMPPCLAGPRCRSKSRTRSGPAIGSCGRAGARAASSSRRWFEAI